MFLHGIGSLVSGRRQGVPFRLFQGIPSVDQLDVVVDVVTSGERTRGTNDTRRLPLGLVHHPVDAARSTDHRDQTVPLLGASQRHPVGFSNGSQGSTSDGQPSPSGELGPVALPCPHPALS